MDNCFTCRFLLRLTPVERENLGTSLSSLGVSRDFFGACVYDSAPKQFLVRRFLDRPIKECLHWEHGYYQDHIGCADRGCVAASDREWARTIATRCAAQGAR